MAQWDIAVALWNRDTHKKQSSRNAERIQLLKDAVAACDMQFARILKPNQRVIGIFVAPEYYYAAEGAGQGVADFNQRCVTQDEKDLIVADMLELSRKFPRVILVPGTIAWWKPLVRGPSEQYKRDPATNLRTNVLKTTGSRAEAVGYALAQNQNQGGRQGARIATPLLQNKVRRWILDHEGLLKSPPPGQKSRQQEIVGDLLTDGGGFTADQKLTAMFGTAVGMYRGVPDQYDAYQFVNFGTADRVMKNTAYVMLGGTIRFKYNKANDFHEALSDGSMVFCPGYKSGYTTVEGITMGIEICLDHAAGRLINTPLPPSGQPMIQIITSAAVQPTTISTKVGGYWIHASSCDGWAGVIQKTAMGFDHLDPIEKKTVGGDPLKIYHIQLDVP